MDLNWSKLIFFITSLFCPVKTARMFTTLSMGCKSEFNTGLRLM